MTIDEAIKHCEEVAEQKEIESGKIYRAYSIFPSEDDALEYDECCACAEEHKQLAEWLKDYKRMKEKEVNNDRGN